MKKTPRLVITLFLILGAFSLLSSATSLAQEHKEVVKIGVIIPLTTGQATRGEDIRRMLEILQEHFSTKSKKYSFEFLIDDGKCGLGNSATTIAMKFVNVDKIRFMITGCSGETLQAGRIAQNAGVVDFAVLSNHQDVKALGDYVFRTFIDIERGIQLFAAYLRKSVNGKIALLTEENAFTLGMKELLLKNLGDKIAFADDFQAESNDFNTLLARVRASGAKAVYYNTLTEVTLANLVNQTHAQKLDVQIFSYLMPEIPAFRTATGHNSDGIVFLGTPAVSSSSAEFKEVYDEFIRRHEQILSFEILIRAVFDAVKSICDSIEAVGPDAAKVKEYLKTYKSEGALGTIEYDENGDIKNIDYVMKRLESDGSIALLGNADGK